MSEFEAVGRDVAQAAEAEADDPAVAGTIKSLWRWAGLEEGANPNHLWKVEWWKNDNGFAVAASLVDENVWAPEPTPAPPASPEELRQQTVVEADAAASDAPAVEEPAAEVAAPADPPEAASDPGSTAAPEAGDDAATA